MRVGVGEGAALVPEQLALEERVEKGTTVHGDEGMRGSSAQAVDGAGQELLARSRLACDEHGPFGLGEYGQPREDLPEGRRVADDSGYHFRVRTAFSADGKQSAHLDLSRASPPPCG